MNWLAQLTEPVQPPAWSGPRTQYLHLTDGDERDAQVDEPRDDAPTHLHCRPCNRILPATPEFFYRARREKTGFMYECKQCHSARQSLRRPPKQAGSAS